MRIRWTTLAILLFLATAESLSASVAGTLNVLDCTGGGVTVTAVSIDWFLPMGGGTGCLTTGSGTNVTYASGVLLAGNDGSIKDIAVGASPTVVDFMTFTGVSGLAFDLTALGPGVLNTGCAASFISGPGCSVFPSSPFVLAPDGTGTTATLPASGTATDGMGSSVWTGTFSIVFPGLAPSEIQTYILGSDANVPGLGCTVGSCTMQDTGIFLAALSASGAGPGYRGTFTITAVPEPVSLLLTGTGMLLLLAGLKRRAI